MIPTIGHLEKAKTVKTVKSPVVAQGGGGRDEEVAHREFLGQ